MRRWRVKWRYLQKLQKTRTNCPCFVGVFARKRGQIDPVFWSVLPEFQLVIQASGRECALFVSEVAPRSGVAARKRGKFFPFFVGSAPLEFQHVIQASGRECALFVGEIPSRELGLEYPEYLGAGVW